MHTGVFIDNLDQFSYQVDKSCWLSFFFIKIRQNKDDEIVYDVEYEDDDENEDIEA